MSERAEVNWSPLRVTGRQTLSKQRRVSFCASTFTFQQAMHIDHLCAGRGYKSNKKGFPYGCYIHALAAASSHLDTRVKRSRVHSRLLEILALG